MQLNSGNRSNSVGISDAQQAIALGKFYVIAQPDDYWNNTLTTLLATSAMKTEETILRLQGSANSGANPTFLKGINSANSSTMFEILHNGDANFNGRLDLQHDGTNGTILRAQGDEAIWYNDSYFSWGFGGSYNQFADAITIGTSTQPRSFMGLRIDSNRGLEIVGNGDILIEGNAENSILFQNTIGTNRSEIKSTQDFLSIRDKDQVIFRVGFADMMFITPDNVQLDTDLDFTPTDGLTWHDGNDFSATIFADPDRLKISHEDRGEIQVSGQTISLLSNTGGGIWIENGGVGIGEPSPSHALEVNGDVGVTGNFYALSDRREKRDIEKLDMLLTDILRLSPSSFYWVNKENEQASIGLIAQEVEEIFPRLVHTSDAGKKMVNYQALSVLAVQGIKEQQDRIDKLEEQVYSLISRLELLDKK